jgi:uncharacterized protein
LIIDMRLRPPLETWVTKSQFRKGNVFYPTRIGFPRPRSAEDRSIEFLLQEMDEAGIELGVIMGRQSNEPQGSIPNDEISACVDRYPHRFVAWAGLDLSQSTDWWLGEIRRCLALPGFKGVSIEPSIARDASFRRPDDKRLYPIYEECLKLSVPINITLSAALQLPAGKPYEDSSPIPLYQVARDFPKLQIHVAHAAWPYVMEMIGVCFVCPNIWLSPDQYMIPQIPGAHEYVRAANHYFQDRTLFGTAYPSKPHKEMVECYKAFNWSAGMLENVFGRNARRLMGMD